MSGRFYSKNGQTPHCRRHGPRFLCTKAKSKHRRHRGGTQTGDLHTQYPASLIRRPAKEADTSNANSKYIKPPAHKKHEREVSRERETHNSCRLAPYKRGRVVNADAKPSPLSYTGRAEIESERAGLIMNHVVVYRCARFYNTRIRLRDNFILFAFWPVERRTNELENIMTCRVFCCITAILCESTNLFSGFCPLT